jgi:L-threonylcarbamoyladenylate synthase
MPCDTIYGFVGLAPDTEPLLRRIKGREERSFLQLIASPSWLPSFTEQELPPSLKPFWPGPLTIIFRSRASTGDPATAPSSDLRDAAVPSPPTVALRVPEDPLLVKLMSELGRPLFSTSVNRSGEPSMWRIEEIIERFEEQVSLIVDAGDRSEGVPSTIVDVTNKPFRVLRPGAVALPSPLLE